MQWPLPLLPVAIKANVLSEACLLTGEHFLETCTDPILNCIRIVPPIPRGDVNTEKYCPRPAGPRAIFLRIHISSWNGGYNTDIIY